MKSFIIADSCRQSGERDPLTQELIELVEGDRYLHELLTTSLDRAQQRNGDPVMNPVTSKAEYFNFVDRAVKLVPRDVLENPPRHLRKPLLQHCAYFYYLIDQPPGDDVDDDQHLGAVQDDETFQTWLKKFIREWGMFLDTEESWDWSIYRAYYYNSAYGLQNDWYEPASNWETFNDFFARYLRSPGVRPVARRGDPSIVASPVDSSPRGVWHIDENSKIVSDDGVDVKHDTYYDINVLLGEESKYHDAFAGGTFTHMFLNIDDYHRYHFPVSGTVKEVSRIGGDIKLRSNWNPRTRRYDMDCAAGWQFAQTRGSAVIETEEHGLVAVLPIGMGQVSSVNFEEHVEPGRWFEKGDMLGYFLFGGSDVVMLFQEEANFEQTAPTKSHVLMGEQYGTFTS